MNYKNYAKVLWESFKNTKEKDFIIFLDKFFIFLDSKKENKILPKIYKEIEKLIQIDKLSSRTTITLKTKEEIHAYEQGLEKFKNKFNLNNLTIKENKNIIGGYILKNKDYSLDNS